MTDAELLALIVAAYKWAGTPDAERLAAAFVASSEYAAIVRVLRS